MNYGFNANAKFSVLWQVSDTDAKNSYPFENVLGNRCLGGLITTQISVKF